MGVDRKARRPIRDGHIRQFVRDLVRSGANLEFDSQRGKPGISNGSASIPSTCLSNAVKEALDENGWIPEGSASDSPIGCPGSQYSLLSELAPVHLKKSFSLQ